MPEGNTGQLEGLGDPGVSRGEATPTQLDLGWLVESDANKEGDW